MIAIRHRFPCLSPQPVQNAIKRTQKEHANVARAPKSVSPWRNQPRRRFQTPGQVFMSQPGSFTVETPSTTTSPVCFLRIVLILAICLGSNAVIVAFQCYGVVDEYRRMEFTSWLR